MPNFPSRRRTETSPRINAPFFSSSGGQALASGMMIDPQVASRQGEAMERAIAAYGDTLGKAAELQGESPLAKSFAMLADTADRLGNYTFDMWNTKQTNLAKEQLLNFRREQLKFLSDLQTRQDYDNFGAEYQSWAEKQRKTALNGLEGVHRDGAEVELDYKADVGFIKTRDLALNKAVEHSTALAVEDTQQTMVEFGQAETPEELDQALQENDAFLDRLVSQGVLKPTKAEALKIQRDKAYALAGVRALADYNEAAVLAAWPGREVRSQELSELQKQLKKYLFMLPPSDQETIKNAIQADMRAHLVDAERIAVNQADAILNKLGTGEAGLMKKLDILADPEKVKALGLPLSAQGRASLASVYRARLNDLRSRRTEKRTEQARAEANNIADLILNKDSAGAMKALNAAKGLTAAQKLTLSNAIENLGQIKTNRLAFSDAINRMNDPVNPYSLDDLLADFGNKRYAQADFYRLLTMINTRDAAKKKDIKAAQDKFDYLKQATKRFAAENDNKKDQADFAIALSWAMEKEKLTAHDHEVIKLATTLSESFKTGFIGSTDPVYKGIAEKLMFGEEPTRLTTKDGRVYYDSEIEATPKETARVHEMLSERGIRESRYSKYMALDALRKGEAFEMPEIYDLYTREEIQAVIRILEKMGKSTKTEVVQEALRRAYPGRKAQEKPAESRGPVSSPQDDDWGM